MKKPTVFFLTLLSNLCLACTDGTGFLPPPYQKIPISEKMSGLTQEQYEAVISKIESIYAPIVKDAGAELIINRKWESSTVNAGTYRDKNQWIINLYGGFARHPAITEDGYALVICHEIGHHLGGAPKKTQINKPIWPSTEGQSDYFATLKCLRKIFRKDDNIAAIQNLEIPESVRETCEANFPREWEKALCMRTSLAGLSVALVMNRANVEAQPSFDTKDENEVIETLETHPSVQCRLDTYFQGSVCEVSSYISLSQYESVSGSCHRSLGHQTGLRPVCWFSND